MSIKKKNTNTSTDTNTKRKHSDSHNHTPQGLASKDNGGLRSHPHTNPTAPAAHFALVTSTNHATVSLADLYALPAVGADDRTKRVRTVTFPRVLDAGELEAAARARADALFLRHGVVAGTVSGQGALGAARVREAALVRVSGGDDGFGARRAQERVVEDAQAGAAAAGLCAVASAGHGAAREVECSVGRQGRGAVAFPTVFETGQR